MADVDFSRVNLHYLICVRDLARQAPERMPVLLGTSEPLGQLLAELTAEDLAAITRVKAPLLVPRKAPWWWRRLFTAIHAGRAGEIEAVLEHAGLLIADR